MTARLDMIGIIVEDMGRALAFYRRLGLDVPAEADSQPHVETTLPGGIRLAWDSEEVARSIDPTWQRASGGHVMSLAFLLDSPADVDRLYQELTEAGYVGHKEPWDAFWGQRYAVVDDPDGNPVDLFAALNAG